MNSRVKVACKYSTTNVNNKKNGSDHTRLLNYIDGVREFESEKMGLET